MQPHWEEGQKIQVSPHPIPPKSVFWVLMGEQGLNRHQEITHD